MDAARNVARWIAQIACDAVMVIGLSHYLDQDSYFKFACTSRNYRREPFFFPSSAYIELSCALILLVSVPMLVLFRKVAGHSMTAPTESNLAPLVS